MPPAAVYPHAGLHDVVVVVAVVVVLSAGMMLRSEVNNCVCALVRACERWQEQQQQLLRNKGDGEEAIQKFRKEFAEVAGLFLLLCWLFFLFLLFLLLVL